MKEPYSLPEDQRERVTRTEMHSLQWLLNDISSMSYAQEDLAKRLECVPAGMQRMRLATGQLRSLLRDLFGTIPEKQRRQIQNAAKDMEVRLVPKLTPRKVSLVLEEETAKELVNAAQAKCKYDCVPDLDGDRNCELCKLLEAVIPLEKYESSTCPYWHAEWEDK